MPGARLLLRTLRGPAAGGAALCAVRAFCRRQNPGAGAIHLPRACKIKGVPGGRKPAGDMAAKERYEHLTRLVELYK